MHCQRALHFGYDGRIRDFGIPSHRLIPRTVPAHIAQFHGITAKHHEVIIDGPAGVDDFPHADAFWDIERPFLAHIFGIRVFPYIDIALGKGVNKAQRFCGRDGARSFSLKKCEQVCVYHVTVIGPAAQSLGGIIDMHGSLLDEHSIRENGAPERQTAKERRRIRKFHLASPRCVPAKATLIEVPHAMPMLPTFSLLSPFRESIAENARSIKNGGQPWGGGMYGQSVLRCILDTVKAGRRPYHPGRRRSVSGRSLARMERRCSGCSRISGDLGGQTFRFRPRDWNEKALTANAVRAFSFGLPSSSSCGKALCSAAAFRRPLPVANAASARSASGYPSLRPFYSQGRPRWAHPCRNRNAP